MKKNRLVRKRSKKIGESIREKGQTAEEKAKRR